MSDALFLSAVARLTERNLTVAELIDGAEGLKNAGHPQQAAQLYGLWTRCNAGDPMLHVILFNRAVVLADIGDLAAAREALEESIRISPDFHPSYINLGSVYERLGMIAEAIAQWSALAGRLAQITGSAIDYKLSAMKQVGRVLETNHLGPNAELVLKQSLEIKADQADVIQHYIALRLAQCEWPVMEALPGVTSKQLLESVGPLSAAIYTDDPLLQLASSYKYNRHVIGYPDHDLSDRHAARRDQPGRAKRRIGYVSSDLRNHAVGFIMAELFEQHDRENCEIYVYYCGIAHEDALQVRIRSNVDRWVDLRGMTDEQAAEQIAADEIDILVDVNGYTKDARTKIFALKPAPVIVNWLGFPGTMASPYHHYIVADESVIPPEHEIYFSEKVVRLPCYQPNDRRRVISPVRPTRAEFGLPEDETVFCCFNGAQKISRFAFDRWMAILSRVPGSVLWVLTSNHETTNERLKIEAQARGIAPERIVFADKRPNPDHLARYPLADLFLDTGSYGAHVTASDSLWMGVPIVTIAGRGFAARVCTSLSRAAGMDEMVCATPEEYIEKAVALGNDRAAIARLKEKLEAGRETCTLFDTEKLARHLEGLYESMWDDFLSNNLPRPNLTNLEVYLDIGAGLDDGNREMLAAPDYHGLYRTELARRHRYATLPADGRLWTEADIAEAEGDGRTVPLRRASAS